MTGNDIAYWWNKGKESRRTDEESCSQERGCYSHRIFTIAHIESNLQMTEFDISKIAAEKVLRQNHGELIPTINQLINV
jgi:HYPK UBA domain